MMEAGFTDYLSKPVNTADMEDMLKKYLPKSMIHEEPEEGAAERGSGVVETPPEILPGALFSIAQLNPEKGLDYCGDVEDYLEMLGVYVNSAEEKAAGIEESLSKNDLETYALTVHSLKSTSKAIGAEELSARAAALEAAARENKTDVLEEDTPAFLSDYKDLKEQISHALEEPSDQAR